MGAELDTLRGYGDPVRVGDIARMTFLRGGERTDEGVIVITGIHPVDGTYALTYERTERGQGVPCGCLLQTLIGRRTLQRLPRRGEVGR